MIKKFKKMFYIFLSSSLISLIIFFVFRGVIGDMFQEYYESIPGTVVYSMLNYIIFIFSLNLMVGVFVSILLLIEKEKIKRHIQISLISVVFTIIMISFISFLYTGYSLRFYFDNMDTIEKISAFYLWNTYFMVYVLNSLDAYFMLLYGVYFISYMSFYTIVTRDEK